MDPRPLLLLLAGCVALPVGFEGATRVDDLTQSLCDQSPYDTGFEEAATATAADGGLRVVYDPVHFRCEQDVEGFFVVHGDTVDLLVRPRDMSPRMVAGCDCGYVVDAKVAATGATVRAYRQWDDLNDDNDPVLIDEIAVP